MSSKREHHLDESTNINLSSSELELVTGAAGLPAGTPWRSQGANGKGVMNWTPLGKNAEFPAFTSNGQVGILVGRSIFNIATKKVHPEPSVTAK